MNKNELHGGARYLGGKVEKAVGDAVGSREWQVNGVVDQVAGGAENLYGRARGIAEDAVDAAPGFVDEAKERLGDAADRARDVADRATDRAHDVADRAGDAAARGTRAANAAVSNNPASWAVFAALGAGIGGYLLGWLIHGERA
ncbi:CsbD family protein [Sphingomonas sp. RHCKR47]|uniref:CsbD family protein n=1 Tax=Sphingomonas citricola TaxID=2862498 RepID=UPI001CA4A670|nr:CsbD family protein [Sphingomonas citricola]MBW6525082.1 CsbD family protein [Sphingomonas citricola]